MRNRIILSLAFLGLLTGCKEKTPEFTFDQNYFSFLEKETVVNVTDAITLFELKGIAENDNFMNVGIEIAENGTTAVEGVHYEKPDKMRMPFYKEQEVELEFIIFPANITEEVQITFTVDLGIYDLKKDGIDKTVVKLIPSN